MVTALAIKDADFVDNPASWTLTTGNWDQVRQAQGFVGQWRKNGGEVLQRFAFEPEKLQGVSSSQVVNAKLRMELRMIYGNADAETGLLDPDSLATVGWDIGAMREEWS